MGWGNWGGFAPYVSKAEKLRRAEKTRTALAKKGIKLDPVIVSGGRDIARTWWGKAWAQNLERYADFSNRIPRGRSYVRNGAVLDLKITPNTVTALVSGSQSQPYKIEVGITSLDKKVEKTLMEKSRTSLDSMQALLSGEFPSDLKDEFFKQGTGLFPSPKEIKLDCSCPDWAEMCKHVAAALYGAAVRLDEKPELFFTLRGIKVDDFVGKMVKRESEKILKKAKQKSARSIAADDSEMSELFGITMDSPTPDAEASVAPTKTLRGKKIEKPEKKTAAIVRKKTKGSKVKSEKTTLQRRKKKTSARSR
jgi:uncharacterized Zn finger protein